MGKISILLTKHRACVMKFSQIFIHIIALTYFIEDSVACDINLQLFCHSFLWFVETLTMKLVQ